MESAVTRRFRAIGLAVTVGWIGATAVGAYGGQLLTDPETLGPAAREAVWAMDADLPLAELLTRLAAAGVPAGEVRTLDRVYEWDQTRSQGLVISVDHPQLGDVELPGPPLRLDDNAYAGGREQHAPPPRLGEHNESVRRWLDERESAAATASGPQDREQ